MNSVNANHGLTGQVINDIKLVIKSWRNRALSVADTVLSASEILNWRIQFYLMVTKLFENSDPQNVKFFKIINATGHKFSL